MYSLCNFLRFQHAHCLDLLDEFLQPGMKALDVGCGSGYFSACMGHMVGEKGKESVYHEQLLLKNHHDQIEVSSNSLFLLFSFL